MTASIRTSMLLILLFCCSGAYAQQFENRAKLDAVNAPGFYSIELNPGLCSYLRADFADLRIADEKGGWVPHIIRKASGFYSKASFIEFPVFGNTTTDSGKTELILQNNHSGKISNIKLFVKNAAVSRLVSLSGSNDRKNWYIIDDQLLLQRSYETREDEYQQDLSFPPSSYRFFRLLIDNQQNDPLNIVRGGFYNTINISTAQQYYQNPEPAITKKDSGNRSFVLLKWAEYCHIERLRLIINGTKYFNRVLSLYVENPNANGLGTMIGSFRIASFSDNVFDIPRTKTNRLWIVIINEDSPPLEITRAETEQIKTSAIVHFDKKGDYYLLLNSEKASPPDYDLVLFKDSIPSSVSPIKAGPVTQNRVTDDTDKNSGRWWIWPAILFCAVILIYFSYSLIREMKKNSG